MQPRLFLPEEPDGLHQLEHQLAQPLQRQLLPLQG